MIDSVAPLPVEFQAFRLVFVPAQTLGGGSESSLAVNLSACADQRVAVDELGAEPRTLATFINRVAPERYLRKLYSDGIEVDTIHVAVGNIHFDLL